MIKPEELRIGNKLQAGSQVITVKAIWSDGEIDTPEEGVVALSHSQLTGIPLTDDWLLKLGFWEKYKSSCNRWYLRASHLRSGCEIIDPEDDETGKLTGKFYCRNSEGDFDVPYVHQLQNLYFALTQEELTLK